MLLDVTMLVVSLGVILLAAVTFTNAIELLGQRLGLHQGTVGSILAAVGTAMPETIIPIIAIVNHPDAQSQGVAIGAIVGAPFMLGTLALFITGLAVVIYALLGRRPMTMSVDTRLLRRDLTFFVLVYTLALLLTVLIDNLAFRIAVACGLLAAYGVYLRQTLATEALAIGKVERLYLARILRTNPRTGWVVVQLAVSMIIMVGGAHLFVEYVKAAALLIGVPALVLSLIITPIATELPEKFNSVIWIGRNRDILSLGNITGAMVFQSTLPVAFGVAFTTWNLTDESLASAVLGVSSALLVLTWVAVRKSLSPFILMAGGPLYAAYLLYMFWWR